MEGTADMKILFLGLDGVGKTTIITKLLDLHNEEIKEIYPTAFLSCHRIKFNSQPVNLIEVSGLKRYRNSWKMFYNDVHGIIFVIDGTDISRIRIVKELITQLDKDLVKMMPICFLVNKQDINNSMTVEEIKDHLEVDRVNTNFIWKFVRGVAYNGIGITDAINFIKSQTTDFV